MTEIATAASARDPRIEPGARTGPVTCPAVVVNGRFSPGLRERTLPYEATTAGHAARRQAGQEERKGPRRGRPARLVLDLIWKVHDKDGIWYGTLRNDPTVVVAVDDQDKLPGLLRDLAVAILQGHGDDVRRFVEAANADSQINPVWPPGSDTGPVTGR